MRRYFYLLTAYFLICVIGCGDRMLALPDSAPTVTLENGILEGTHLGPAQNDVAFLGIPYAAPPVGELRWKPPQPVNKWNGARQATQFGAPCPQLPAAWFPFIGWNEDCLYLNVWTPQPSASAKLPVFVYFHGGSNTQGYGQMTPLGPALSGLGLVVVSANYRLGPFGFLAHPALTAASEHHSSGNYGLLDQLQALKWIHENISRFGGDPSQVTVMGQSAGAVDICLLMASPLAAGSFQRAILESGECQGTLNEDIRSPVPYNYISGSGEGAGESLAKDLGIGDDPGILQKLRSIPAAEILKAWDQDRQVHFGAIVDGWVIPEQPAKIFAEGKQMHIPVIVGSNADEATVFGHGGPKTIAEYKSYLRGDTGQYSDEEFRAYPAHSDADVPARYLQIHNDSFAYGAYSMARTMTHVGQRAYLYYFTYAETGKRSHLGAYHGEELQFLSKSFPADWEHSRDDEKLGEQMRAYWANFARSGNPNTPGLTEWPAYDARLDQSFELGRTIRVRPVEPPLRALDQIMRHIFADVMSGTGVPSPIS
jgi:para-nitrobenzyl esterase